MSRADFEESRQYPAEGTGYAYHACRESGVVFAIPDGPGHPAEACTEVGADPDRIGCGTRGRGLGAFAWLLLVSLLALIAVLLIAHFAARWS